MKTRPYPRWLSRLFILAMTALAFTGAFQMPLARRYYLTDIPGLAWTGDFFLVHKLHYICAAVLLFVVALVTIHWLLEWRKKLTLSPLGMIRVVVLTGIIVSGGLRVYRNMPDVTLAPIVILTIEWVHLGLSMVMGLLALTALIRGCSAYVRLR